MSDLIFHYKVLGSPIKLSHAEMNQNLRSIEDAVGIVRNAELVSSEASDLAVNAGSVAVQAKEDAVTAKGQAESAKDAAVIAKNAAEQASTGAQAAKDTAVSANTTAQGAKTAAELARNDSVAARNIAQTSATTATNAKNAAETARNTATQKANEANQSAIDAEYWAGLSEESAGEVTSVQGKKGKVDLQRTDFSWMGTAATKDVGEDTGNLMEVGAFGLGSRHSNPLPKTGGAAKSVQTGFYTGPGDGSTGYPDQFQYGNFLMMNRAGVNVGIAIRQHTTQGLKLGIITKPSGVAAYEFTTIHHTGNLPQATQAELNAGTQTAPRLFSPKQLAEGFYSVSSLPTATQAEIDEGSETEPRLFSPEQLADNFKPNIYEVFTESGVWVKPKGVHAINAMIVGGGGGRKTTSAAYDGVNGGYMVVTIPLSHLPEGTAIDVIVGSGGARSSSAIPGSRGGDSSFLDFESEGGSGGRSGLVGSGGNNFRLVTTNESLVPAPGYPMGNPTFSTRTEGRGVGGTTSSPDGSPGIVKIWT